MDEKETNPPKLSAAAANPSKYGPKVYNQNRGREIFSRVGNVMNRLLLSIVTVSLLAAGFFVARVPFSSSLSAVSVLFLGVLALPTILATVKWLGWRRGALVLFVLSVYALALETIALRTGFPYGHFVYADKLGARLWGTTPWTVPLAFVPLVLGALSAVWRHAAEPSSRIGLAIILLVATDLVLDPGAVAVGLWHYTHGGWYGVPLTNYLGWILSGGIAVVLLYRLAWPVSSADAPPPAMLQLGLFLTLTLWSQVAAVRGLYVPAFIGLGLCVFLGRRLFSPPVTLSSWENA